MDLRQELEIAFSAVESTVLRIAENTVSKAEQLKMADELLELRTVFEQEKTEMRQLFKGLFQGRLVERVEN